MDRDETIKLLKSGQAGIIGLIQRLQSGEAIPDLSGADLNGADLYQARLDGAVLMGAYLNGAHLRSTDLSGADLSGADLRGAIIHSTYLGGADLSGASLLAANFNGTDLSGTDLSRAVCGHTVFADMDLSGATGLDKVVHVSPCSVGIDTLLNSKGKIPDVFLRGCGVPDYLIENQKALIGSIKPIQFYSCFISFSSKDQAFADRLYSRMVQEKLRVWYAPEDMRGGLKSIDQIDEAIRVHDKLLLVLSKASMASDWVLHEIRRAVERERRENRRILFPIGLASRNDINAWTAFDADMGRDLAKIVREYHIPAFSNWKAHDTFEAAFSGLIRDLQPSEATK